MGSEILAMGFLWYGILLASIVLHEAAHGFAAWRLGDSTAYQLGQVTLDPIVHIRRSPFGLLILPIISFLLMGWMIGWASTSYDPYWAMYNRKKAGLMALAGPMANLALVLVAGIAIRLCISAGWFQMPDTIAFERVAQGSTKGFADSVAVAISIVFSLNLILLVFNLIPLPPLDGSAVLTLFLSDRAAQRYNELLHNPSFAIFGLVIAWQVFGAVVGPLQVLAANLLYPGAGYQ
jgi:Zn-dependent protease